MEFLIAENRGQRLRLELAPHTRQRWRETAFVAQVLVAESAEQHPAVGNRPTGGVPRMTGVAAIGSQRVSDLFRVAARRRQSFRPRQRSGQRRPLPVVEAISRRTLGAVFPRARSGQGHLFNSRRHGQPLDTGRRAAQRVTRGTADRRERAPTSSRLLGIDSPAGRGRRTHLDIFDHYEALQRNGVA